MDNGYNSNRLKEQGSFCNTSSALENNLVQFNSEDIIGQSKENIPDKEMQNDF